MTRDLVPASWITHHKICILKMQLLELPAEIRLHILQELLSKKTIKVEAELLVDPLDNNEKWTMKDPGGLQPGILRVCRVMYSEAQPLIYTSNVFDCSQREGTELLLQRIGPANFTQIKHLILEWDQLLDLSWTLSKDPSGSHFAGLEMVMMATWRTRILGGSSLVWQQNKNYERQLCTSAINILRKHPRLAFLVQIPYRKPSVRSVHSNNNYRVKWRFVSTEQALHVGETMVDLESELALLQVKTGDAAGEPVQQMMDPF